MPAEPQYNHTERQLRMLESWLSKTCCAATDARPVGDHAIIKFSSEDDIAGLAGKTMIIFEHNPNLKYEFLFTGMLINGVQHGHISFIAVPGYLPRRQPNARTQHAWTIDDLYSFVRNASTLRVTPSRTTESKEHTDA